ncbi:unannotated protein [freshwater metagenome]|jgi:hypothetical protein|uniref:Unannotated protein n=1 Tax=freshwater metagenome TaxID=449393 RepID=A0A6J7FM01_9ZZZZ|nr:hypothetical protein [Actinomycetota bacterium]MSW48536.1 hypothetical protein [Actinomycetota bacterium]
MIAISSLSLLFAAISVVSASTLVVMMMQESRSANRNNGMVAFRRHLDALSDDSRAHVRQQLHDQSGKQGRR